MTSLKPQKSQARHKIISMRLQTRNFPEALNGAFYEVFLSPELGSTLNWFRGDLLFLSNAGKQTLVVLVDWIQNCPLDTIVVSQQVCNNIHCYFQDSIEVTRLSHEVFPLERVKFLPMQNQASDRPTQEILHDTRAYFSNNTWHPVTTGWYIKCKQEQM